MDIIRVFGTNVRKLRKEKNISQEKLAELSGLHRTYISDIQKIADALEINTYKLYIE